jgi:RND family efflux transporter MFP subunit
MITAPFSGVVSDVGVSLGETAQAGKTVISMLAVDSYEIEAKVPEIDLIKVKVGQEVEVTLDAYGKDQIFKAVVTRINPTATIEGSVPMYKVIVTFTGKDERVRQGMTANVGIITEQKEKVVTVPARFVSFMNQTNGKVTLFTKEKNEIEKEITVGARGDDGAVEVLSGLVTGDVVVMPTTKSRSPDKGGK